MTPTATKVNGKNSDKSHGSTGMFPHRLGVFLPLVGHLPSENSILSNFSSPRGVAILGCESHSQAGSAKYMEHSKSGQHETLKISVVISTLILHRLGFESCTTIKVISFELSTAILD